MPIHVSVTKVAVGFLKTAAKAQVDAIKKKLIDVGRTSAVTLACAGIKARTGLSQEICQSAGNIVVSKLSKVIREKIKR